MFHATKKNVMNTTQRRVLAQLRENTGRSLYDSGGAYGRQWERNRVRDLVSEPEIGMDIQVEYPRKGFLIPDHYGVGQLRLTASANTYHWMTRLLRHSHYARCMERRLNKLIQQAGEKHEDDSYWKLFERVTGEVLRQDGCDGTLDQAWSSAIIQLGGRHLLAISLHNGADIRSGWTYAALYEGMLFDPAITAIGGCYGPAVGQLDIHGERTELQRRFEWETTDGVHWKALHMGSNLEGIPATIFEEDLQEEGAGPMTYFDGKRLFCPFTGEPITFHLS